MINIKMLNLIKIFFIGSALFGTYNFYSPIPVQDYWDQAINFYIHVIENDSIDNWFGLHNEHRIVLVRIFYWFIFKYLPSSEYLLTLLNVLIITYLCFFNIQIYKAKSTTNQNRFVVAILIALSFFWSQKINFFFEVQSQILLSVLLPALAFLFFENYLKNSKKITFFFAIFFSLLSTLTVAAGIFSSLVILFYLLLYKKNDFKIIVTTTSVTIINFFFYFKDFGSQSHSSLIDNLITYNFEIFRFFFGLIGNPIHFILGKGDFVGLLISPLIGLFIFYIFIRKLLTNVNDKSGKYCFEFMILSYLFIYTFLISVGRISFGLEDSFSGRHTTVTLMITSYTLILFRENINVFFSKKYKLTAAIFYIILFLMSIYQLSAFKDNRNKFFDRSVAGLALSLRILEPVFLDKIYPYHDRLKNISEIAQKYKLSMFGKDLFDVSSLNKKINLSEVDKINSLNINFDNLEKYSDFTYFKTNISVEKNNKSIKKVLITDKNNIVVGYAFLQNKKLVGFYHNGISPIHFYY